MVLVLPLFSGFPVVLRLNIRPSFFLALITIPFQYLALITIPFQYLAHFTTPPGYRPSSLPHRCTYVELITTLS